jgi:DNA polymerase-3 subunit epsilon
MELGPEQLESLARQLEGSPDYRVLRRVAPLPMRPVPDGLQTRQGLFVDVETTGLDPATDEIIELAMLPFTYGLDGEIYGVHPPFSELRQPSGPIPPEVTRLTGIDDAVVAGHRLDPDAVAAFIAPAALIVAHNAAFDRLFLEAFSEAFAAKPWGCSLAQVPWSEEGFEGGKLGHLLMQAGRFFDGHRAVHDCEAAVELLSLPLPRSGRPGLLPLLAAARAPGWRIWATQAPFEAKDLLKARGYRWNDGENGRPRAWNLEVADSAKADELSFLQTRVYGRAVELPVTRIDAYNRFSARA